VAAGIHPHLTSRSEIPHAQNGIVDYTIAIYQHQCPMQQQAVTTQSSPPKDTRLYTRSTQIFTISTLALSHSLCAIAAPLSLSSSLTFAGRTTNLAYVPAALRLLNVPGLITNTLSTT
jgi:hypothetical protein